MNWPRVMNVKFMLDYETGVNIMRPSKFGNPFTIGKDGDRDEVCDKYERYILTRPDLIEAAKRELKGKNLICCCKPYKRCHGDTLLRIANELDENDYI